MLKMCHTYRNVWGIFSSGLSKGAECIIFLLSCYRKENRKPKRESQQFLTWISGFSTLPWGLLSQLQCFINTYTTYKLPLINASQKVLGGRLLASSPTERQGILCIKTKRPFISNIKAFHTGRPPPPFLPSTGIKGSLVQYKS